MYTFTKFPLACVLSVVLDALCKSLYARFTWITTETADVHIWGSESCWCHHSMHICMLKLSKYSVYLSEKLLKMLSDVFEMKDCVLSSCGVLLLLYKCACGFVFRQRYCRKEKEVFKSQITQALKTLEKSGKGCFKSLFYLFCLDKFIQVLFFSASLFWQAGVVLSLPAPPLFFLLKLWPALLE